MANFCLYIFIIYAVGGSASAIMLGWLHKRQREGRAAARRRSRVVRLNKAKKKQRRLEAGAACILYNSILAFLVTLRY